MGVGTSQVLQSGHLRRSAFPFARWQVARVKELLDSLKRIGTFVMVETQFCAWIASCVPTVTEPDVFCLFNVLDSSKNGRVNCLEFLAGVMMLSDEDFPTKTQFCFELYDFNLNGSLSRHEVVLMVRSTVLGTLKLLELDPSQNSEALAAFERDSLFEHVADQAIRVYDRDANRSLSYMEFVSWARGNREVMSFVEMFGVFSRAAAEEAREARASAELLQNARQAHSRLAPDDPFVGAAGDPARGAGDESMPDVLGASDGEDRDQEVRARQDAETQAAAAYASMTVGQYGPCKSLFEGHLEIDWVYGYSGRTGHNTAKYVDANRERIVYPVGSCVVVRHSTELSQMVYSGHADNVVAVEVHPNGRVIASADVSGEVHIWTWNQQSALVGESVRPHAEAILKAMPGMAHLAFSRSGQLLAVACNRKEAVAATRTCTDRSKNTFIDVWDWALKERVVDPLYISAESINDVAWAPDDDVLAACGSSFAKLYTFREADTYASRFLGSGDAGAARELHSFIEMDADLAAIGPSLQILTSLCFLGKNIVAGTANGELCLFSRAAFALEQVVRAHSEKHPVRCLAEWGRGLVSGADDGELKIWDMGLHPLVSVRPPKKRRDTFHEESKRLGERSNGILLVSPHDSLSFVDTRISSLNLVNKTKSKIALVGMASGELFEINLDERTGSSHRTKVYLVESHAGGSLAGIAVHPRSSSLFATASESDSTVRIWDALQHRVVRACLLDAPPTCLAFAPSGEYIAIGLANGRVSIRDPATAETLESEVVSVLSPESGQDGRLCTQRKITALAFSPDGAYLAIACLSGATYLFTVRRQNQTKYKAFVCIKALKPSHLAEQVGPTVNEAALDWSQDAAILKVALRGGGGGGGGQPMHHYLWDVAAGGNLVEDTPMKMRQVQWHSMQSPEDWAVSGLPRQFQQSATCYDASGGLLAVGDAKGSVVIVRYPCSETIASSQLKPYSVERHNQPVGAVRFLGAQCRVMVAPKSAIDGHFVQWRVVHEPRSASSPRSALTLSTTAEQELHDHSTMDAGGSLPHPDTPGPTWDEPYDSEVEAEILCITGSTFATPPEATAGLCDLDGNDPFDNPWANAGPQGAGDQALPRWQRSFVGPTKAAETKRRAEQEAMGITQTRPDAEVKLDWVIGFGSSGQKTRTAVRYLADHNLAYPAAAVVVVAKLDDKAGRTPQRYFQRHDAQVDALACTPQRSFAASAQGARVLVWEAATLNVVASISLPWAEGVSHLAFSTDEDLLCVVGKDLNQTIAVFDWRKERLKGLSPGGGKVVLDLVWTGPRAFVCVGKRHVTFWHCNKAEEGPPESRRGSFSSRDGKLKVPLQTVLSVCVVDPEHSLIATGFTDGTIALWDTQARCVVSLLIPAGSHGPVYCMCPMPTERGAFLAGHKSGQVTIVAPTDVASLVLGGNEPWSPHDGGMDSMWTTKQLCSMHGSIRSLDASPKAPKPTQNGSMQSYGYGGSSGFGSLQTESRRAYVAVGTRHSQVLELQVERSGGHVGSYSASQPQVLSESHSGDEIWGLAVHPTEQLVVTAGDDGTIRVWDLNDRRQVGQADIGESHVKAVAFRGARQDGAGPLELGEIAAGLTSGKVVVFEVARTEFGGNAGPSSTGGDAQGQLDSVRLTARTELADPADWVQSIRYSATGALLAVGCHTGKIYVYDTASYALLHTLVGHSSIVAHLDWAIPEAGAADGTSTEILQSASTDGELLYWNATAGSQVKSSSALRDLEWATWSSPKGWPVGGVECQSFSSCALSDAALNLAMGTKSGSVLLYAFPCPSGSRVSFKKVQVHAGTVTQVAFASQDRFAVSVGLDGCICVYKTENMEDVGRLYASWRAKSIDERTRLLRAHEQRKALEFGAPPPHAPESALDAEQEGSSSHSHSAALVADSRVEVNVSQSVPTVPWHVNRVDWRKNIIPSVAKAWSSAEERDAVASLDWVYGHSAGTGAHYVGNRDDILFTAANVAVVQKPVRDGKVARQTFFVDHEHDIVAVTVTLDGRTVATGDQSGCVFVWDSNTMLTRSRVQLGAAIRSLAFSPGGKYLGIVDTSGVFALCEAASGRQLTWSRDETPHSCITGLVVLPRSESRAGTDIDIVTVGGQTFKLWTFDPVRAKLTSTSAKTPQNADITCVAEFAGGIATGHRDGSLVLWSREGASKRRVLAKGDLKAFRVPGAPQGVDTGPIAVLAVTRTNNLLCLHEGGVALSIDARLDPAYGSSIYVGSAAEHLSPCRMSSGDRVLITLRDGALLEVDSSRGASCTPVQCGHPAALTPGRTRDPLQGQLVLATFEHGLTQFAITAGRNKEVCLWDLDSHKRLATKALPDAATACAVSPSAHHVAVGTKGGSLLVFSDLIQRKVLDIAVSYHQSGDHAKDGVRSLRYSSSGSFLAIGCDDAQVRILETRNYALVAVLPRSHTSPVTHLDWTTDDKLLRSNACLDALPVGDALKIVPRPAVDELAVSRVEDSQDAAVLASLSKLQVVCVRDPSALGQASDPPQWSTLSCPLGEHTMSVWGSSKLPVSSARVFDSGTLAIVLADGSLVSGKGMPLTKVRHRGAGVVQATSQAKYLVSAGLYDGLVFQFKVGPPPKR